MSACFYFYLNFTTRDFNALSPSCSSSGLGMMAAVDAGEQTAVQFYHDHVNEVLSVYKMKLYLFLSFVFLLL